MVRTARRNVKAIAELQASDINKMVARSDVLASRMWKALMSQAQATKQRLASGSRVRDADPELVQDAVTELTDIMTLSYLQRTKLNKRRRSMTKDAIALASPVAIEAKKVAQAIDIDLGNITKRFETLAGKSVKKSMSDARFVMNQALADATSEGLHADDATTAVIAALRDHGIQPRSSSYVETLVRTHSAIAYGSAHKDSFANDVDLWGYTYLTVGDDRVRPEHEQLDGVTRKKDDPFWETFWPPNGWNCRCQAVAIYDEDTKQTRIPEGVEPDEGFDTDFTELGD